VNATRPRRHFVAVVVLALVAVACGRGDSASDSGGATGAKPAGLADGPGFDLSAGTIRVALLTPLSGPVQVIGEPLLAGLRARFDGINAKGGIGGRFKVEVVAEDNQYDVPTSVQLYQKVRDGVTMLALVGTPHVNGVLPQLKADGVVALAGSLDANWIKEINLVPYGGPYQIQFLNGADWYLNEAGGRGTRICAMAIEGPYGDAGVAGLEAAAKADSFTVEETVRYRSTDTDFNAQVGRLADAKCDAVFLTGLPATTGPIVGTGAKLEFTPLWLGQSPTWSTAFSKSEELLPLLEKHFVLLTDGPEWGDESEQGMREMLADIRQFTPDQQPDIYFQAGYLEGMAMAALLEKAVALQDLSRAGILEAQRQLGRVSFGGLAGDWTYGPPEQRNPSRTTTVFRPNAAKPGGLEAVRKNLSSPAAQAFDFAA
jgi:ABC-type branched-subunit amino acid transport system substrate-binding protein